MSTLDTHRPRRRARRVLALATLAPALAIGVATGVATAPAAQADPDHCTTTQLVTTCTFAVTWEPASWVVPAGVESATFTVVGAAGGNAGDRPGGRGGGVVATLPVTPGTRYEVRVGSKGTNDTDPAGRRGGYNGGGHGGGLSNPGGGGGGGASDVRTAPYTTADRVLVGGGGGGAGSMVTYGDTPHGIPGAGGAGGGTGDGTQGQNVSGAWVGAGGGNAGTAAAAGAGGGPSAASLYNGCGFWSPAYPVPGDSGRTAGGGDGGFLVSGTGARCDQFRGWGGGGGGGWYAGGGGGGGVTAGAGGGGGSGHAPAGSTSTVGAWAANGVVTVSYSTWQPVPGGGVITSAPVVAPRPGQSDQHDVFYLDENSQVTQRVVTNGVASPEINLGAVLSPGSSVAAAWRPDGKRLDLFGRGTENALWQKTFTFAGGWNAWHAVTAAGVVDSDPTAVSIAANRVDVFLRGTDKILKRARLIDGEPFSIADVFSGIQLTSAPAAVARPNGDIVVLASGIDPDTKRVQLVTEVWFNRSGGIWNLAYSPKGRLASSAAATALVGDRVGLVVRNDAGGLSWTNVDPNLLAPPLPWRDSTAPSPAGSAPALVTRSGGEGVVYLRGNDDSLIARAIDVD